MPRGIIQSNEQEIIIKICVTYSWLNSIDSLTFTIYSYSWLELKLYIQRILFIEILNLKISALAMEKQEILFIWLTLVWQRDIEILKLNSITPKQIIEGWLVQLDMLQLMPIWEYVIL